MDTISLINISSINRIFLYKSNRVTAQSVTTDRCRVLIWEGFYTEVLVPLVGLSSGVFQRRLFRYYLVIVSMAVACRMSSLSYYCFWAGGLFEREVVCRDRCGRNTQIYSTINIYFTIYSGCTLMRRTRGWY